MMWLLSTQRSLFTKIMKTEFNKNLQVVGTVHMF